MLEIISDANWLQQYQRQFMKELGHAKTDTIRCFISYRPSAEEATVDWSQDIGIWWYSKPLWNRWWNVFGMGRPLPYSTVRIAVEINIPMNGINRNTAGAFAREAEKVFVLHRGNRMGGGKVGITKQLFWTKYRLRWDYAQDGNRMAQVAKVCELGSSKLPSEVAEFVHEVIRIKGLV